VALRRGVEHLRVERPDNVAEIKVTVGQLGNVLAADFAEITFVALGHERGNA
jgi:hypothetical protein